MESPGSSADSLRQETVVSMQTASSDAERRLLTAADDVLDDDCVWEDHENDYEHYLDRPFTTKKNGTGLHSKTAGRQYKKKPGHAADRPGGPVGGKFNVLNDSSSLILQDTGGKQCAGRSAAANPHRPERHYLLRERP